MLELNYDPMLVGLSFIVSVLGSYAGLNLAIRIPGAKAGKDLALWLMMSSAAIGIVAIWSMHYIGMLAVDFGMPVTYGMGLTIGSMILALIFVAIGLFIVGRGTPSIVKLLSGGVVTGLGVAAMHYTGMASMEMPGTMSYDSTLFNLSLIIAVVAATAALWFAFNLRGALQRFGSSVIMGVAVCGMHYVGMAAMEMTPAAGAAMASADSSSAYSSSFLIFGVSVVVLAALMFVASRNAPKANELVF